MITATKNDPNLKIELLAPAGSDESLRSALKFGADAVYLGGTNFGLRAFAQNFDIQQLNDAVSLVHSQNKKIYLTANAAFYDEDFKKFESYVKEVEAIGVDALIVSDPGAISFIKDIAPDIQIHLSTQANTTNSKSASFWHKNGVKRIVLAREMSIEQIKRLRENTPETLDLEAFVHGAMCISYSGRCLLSSVLTGRSGNLGECAQPCRWEYYLYEKGYPGQYFPISEDERGTYILNSKDLMMIEHLGKLLNAGVSSFKIEGRMKSAYYVACTVGAYRRAIDDMLNGKEFDKSLLENLYDSGTRDFTTGFYFGNPYLKGQQTERDIAIPNQLFAAKVLEYDSENGLVKIEQRNKFLVGDTLAVISPNITGKFIVETIKTEDGIFLDAAPHPKQILYINCPFKLNDGDLLKKSV
ncbi:MAG: U32 family peptidase [Eubacteriales bacterium]